MTYLLYAGGALIIALLLAGGSAKAEEIDNQVPDVSKTWLAATWDSVSKFFAESYAEFPLAKVGDEVSMTLYTLDKKYNVIVSGRIVSEDAGFFNVRFSSLDVGPIHEAKDPDITFPIPSMYKGATTNLFFKVKG